MAFWDFVTKIFRGEKKPAAPVKTPAPPGSAAVPAAQPPARREPADRPATPSTRPAQAAGTAALPAAAPAAATATGHQVSDFLPIRRDALLKQGEEARAAGWMWFGRRDLIPPASDARTMLIDRGML